MTADSAGPNTAPWDFDKPRLDLRHSYGGYIDEVRVLFKSGLQALRGAGTVPSSRFVIFGRGRSGSTLLVRLLDQHSKVQCFDEILKSRLLQRERHRDRCLNLGSKPVRGFKLLSYQVTQVHGIPIDSRYLNQMQDSGFRVIYLNRRNYFRLAVSNIYAIQRGQYHNVSQSGQPKVSRFEFEPRHVLSWMEGAERRTAEEARLLEGVDYLPLTYETDLEDQEAHQQTAERVHAWLGLESEPIDTVLNRITPMDWREIVLNHNELAEFLDKTRFAHFLS